MGSPYIVEISELKKYYGKNDKKVVALNGISFKIERSTVFGLLGPNGAGKTTTIKILTTLTKPDSGRAEINKIDVVKEPLKIKSMIGVVPQENNLDRELSAYENLMIYGLLHKVRDLKKKIEDKLEAVGLVDRKDSLVSHFSGGMQRRLLIARALLTEPELLFLDEPTIGLDPQIRRHLWDVIRKTKIDGRTVVLTTHYIEEAEALCDVVGVLSKGELVALDRPENLKKLVGEYVVDVINDEGRLIQYFFKSHSDACEKAKEFQNGAIIRKSNLEDVFVKLTGRRI